MPFVLLLLAWGFICNDQLLFKLFFKPAALYSRNGKWVSIWNKKCAF